MYAIPAVVISALYIKIRSEDLETAAMDRLSEQSALLRLSTFWSSDTWDTLLQKFVHNPRVHVLQTNEHYFSIIGQRMSVNFSCHRLCAGPFCVHLSHGRPFPDDRCVLAGVPEKDSRVRTASSKSIFFHIDNAEKAHTVPVLCDESFR